MQTSIWTSFTLKLITEINLLLIYILTYMEVKNNKMLFFY